MIDFWLLRDELGDVGDELAHFCFFNPALFCDIGEGDVTEKLRFSFLRWGNGHGVSSEVIAVCDDLGLSVKDMVFRRWVWQVCVRKDWRRKPRSLIYSPSVLGGSVDQRFLSADSLGGMRADSGQLASPSVLYITCYARSSSPTKSSLATFPSAFGGSNLTIG